MAVKHRGEFIMRSESLPFLHSRPLETPDEWYIATLLAVAGECEAAVQPE